MNTEDSKAPLAIFTSSMGKTPIGTIGLAIIVFWVLVAIFAQQLAPYDANANHLETLSNPQPTADHWLGTDNLGRDILSRIIFGSRTLLLVTLTAVVSGITLGTTLGLVGGYLGGKADIIVSRLGDIVLSFPVIILYIVLVASIGSSVEMIIVILAVTKAPYIARIVRGITLQVRSKDYISAAQMRGESTMFILFVEILPSATGPLLIELCLRMGYTTIAIGSLNFLGIGLPPPSPDWGSMIKDAYPFLFVWPHMVIAPCFAISSLVIGFNLTALGLREVYSR